MIVIISSMISIILMIIKMILNFDDIDKKEDICAL